MNTRLRWSLGLACLGGLAASRGSFRNFPDVIAGAVLWFVIAFIVISILRSFRNKKTHSKPGTSLTSTLFGNSSTSHSKTVAPVATLDSRSLGQFDVVPGRRDGWYKDPQKTFKLRYFQNGQWTQAAVNSDAESDKDMAILNHQSTSAAAQSAKNQTQVFDEASETQEHLSDRTVKPDIVDQLERLGHLHRSGDLDSDEFQQFKKLLLKQFPPDSR